MIKSFIGAYFVVQLSIVTDVEHVDIIVQGNKFPPYENYPLYSSFVNTYLPIP